MAKAKAQHLLQQLGQLVKAKGPGLTHILRSEVNNYLEDAEYLQRNYVYVTHDRMPPLDILKALDKAGFDVRKHEFEPGVYNVYILMDDSGHLTDKEKPVRARESVKMF